MHQVMASVAALTEAAVSSEPAGNSSVAQTLDQARRALSTHTAWLQRRLSVDDGVGEDGPAGERDEQWTVADVEEEEEEEEMVKQDHLQHSPPPQSKAASSPTLPPQAAKKRISRSRVAPAPVMAVLAEEKEEEVAGQGSSHWATAVDHHREIDGGLSEEHSGSKRARSRWASRAAVFPVTSTSVSDTSPSPIHLFTSSSSAPTTSTAPPVTHSHITPSLPPHHTDNLLTATTTPPLTHSHITPSPPPPHTNDLTAWGSLSSLDNYMESLQTLTQEVQNSPTSPSAALKISSRSERSSENKDDLLTSQLDGNKALKSPSDASESSSTEKEPAENMCDTQSTGEAGPSSIEPPALAGQETDGVSISALMSESTATILTVGPAPKERQSSYKVHQVSKLEEADRGLRLVEIRERESAHLDSVGDTRITVGQKIAVNLAQPSTELGAVEDVLPYKSEDGGPVGQEPQERDTESAVSDDEVFEPPQPTPPTSPPATERESVTALTDVQASKPVTGSDLASANATSDTKVVEKGEGESPRPNKDISFRPRVTSTPAGVLEGVRVTKEPHEELSLPLHQQNKTALSQVSLTSSTSHASISPELKLSRKRGQELPLYTTHHARLAGTTLSPPCPQYGVKQQDITHTSFLQRKRLYSAPTPHQDHPPPSTPSGHSSEQTNSRALGEKHPILRQTMSSPDGERGDEGSRAKPESPLLKSQQNWGEVGAIGESSLSHIQSGPGPLHLAAKCGNSRQVQQLISEGEEVDCRDHEGRTPLMYCIHSRGVHLSCASLLIEAGAGLDRQASDGSTAVHLASAVGAISLIEFALLNRADPDVRDFEGRLPLHWSTMTQQSSKCTALLLKHSKLDINAVDDAGMTPLMWAAYNNNPMVTEFLLGNGADCEEKDRDGMTAMHWAIHQDGVRCLELLLKADHTYFKDHRGRTVLHLSAEFGALAACELILHLRGDAIHDLDRMSRTPLHYAAACSRVDVCVLLLDRGSDAAHRDLTGRTAIEYARHKRLDYVVALLTCHGTAVADFARTSKSGSVSSVLGRAKSISDLPTSEGAPDIVTESLQQLSSGKKVGENEDDDKRLSLCDGGFLGRFVADKNDPLQHFFFWLEPQSSLLHWSRKSNRRRSQQATVYQVHTGASKQLHQNSTYSQSELHQHVFWVLTDCGVLDLLAYNQNSYQMWVNQLRQIARRTEPLTRPGSSQSLGRGETKRVNLRSKRLAAVAPTLTVDHEAGTSVSGFSETSHAFEGDSEIELRTSDTIIAPRLQGSPPTSNDDVI